MLVFSWYGLRPHHRERYRKVEGKSWCMGRGEVCACPHSVVCRAHEGEGQTALLQTLLKASHQRKEPLEGTALQEASLSAQKRKC